MADLIDRAEALRWTRPEEWGTPDERWKPESEYGMMLKALPSAERRGKWIETDMGWDGDIAWVCSVCGEPWTLIDGTPDENCMHYCPNCGAKMEE